MPDVGSIVLDFEGDDLFTGITFTTVDLGKIILLSFIDEAYGECESVILCLEALWNKFGGGDHGVQIVAVVHETTKDDAISWLAGRVTFPVIHSLDIWNQFMFGIDSPDIPHVFIIDRTMEIRKRIFGDDILNCDFLECELLDVIIDREPIDLEMVMDVSDSMNRPPSGLTKFEMMKQAISIIGDYLKDNSLCNDKMGLIWFTDDVSEYQNPSGQKLFPIPANWDEEADLRGKINDHETGICTAMGAGLQTAFDTLSPSTQKKFVILCTDGIQNINPLVKKVVDHYQIINGDDWCGLPSEIVPEHPGIDIADYNTRVHTIGIGITASYEPLLEEIATKTNAFYQGTNDPYTDLDFIYLTTLCNCMAGGSPSILYHNTDSLSVEEHEKAEIFYLNNSVRKITVILSWKKSQESNFMFWLYSPDKTLLNLHNEMRLHENHCMATIYLPKRQNGEDLEYIGKWRMMIRGELPTTPADYHVFIIGEDIAVKVLVDFPRKSYEVGDILPIKVAVLKGKKPIVVKPKEIILEIKSLPVPLPELLAEYKVSVKELLQKTKTRIKKVPKNPLILKLNAMTSDPQFQKRLMPFTQRLSLQKGDFEFKIENKKTFIPIKLEQPGLHSFKITVRYEDPENGPICRTDMISIIVMPGKADPEQTKINFIEPSTDKLKGKIINITPRNKEGQLLGPGYSYEFKLQIGKKEFDVEFEDLLDGTYQIELPISEKEMVEIKEKELDVDITFHNNLIWRGKL